MPLRYALILKVALFAFLQASALDANADRCVHAGSTQEFIRCLKDAVSNREANQCRDPSLATILPVQGNVLSRPGELGSTRRANGITIEVKAGAQVVAPITGTVLFAGDFRSYGPVLIISDGCHKDAVVAGDIAFSIRSRTYVKQGSHVGELLAGSPNVYFETFE